MVKMVVLSSAGLAVVAALQGCDPANTDVYLTNKTGKDILYAPLSGNNFPDPYVGTFVRVPSHERVMVEKNVWESAENAVIKDALTGKVLSKVHYHQDHGTGGWVDISYPPEPPARYFTGLK